MKTQNHGHAASCLGRRLTVGLCAFLLVSASQAQKHMLQPPEDSMWLAASDRALDQLRGGFDLGAGFMVSFGISRAVYINDQLITTMSFQLGDITKITPAQAAALGQQFTAQAQLAPNGPGNTVQPGSPAVPPPASEAPPPASVVSPLATVIQNALNNQTLRMQTVIQANTNEANTSEPTAQTAVQAQVVQNGPGNTVEPSALTVPLATFIQNTVNNQILRTQTVIQASTNALSALRSMNLQATIMEAVANAIGNR